MVNVLHGALKTKTEYFNMEVSLPAQSTPQDFDNPIALAQELEHLKEGHYSRRLYDYILKEMQQLMNCIAGKPALLPFRGELYARIPATDFVRNTLEQLGILHFEQNDFFQKLEDFDKLVEKTYEKLEEYKNHGRTRCWFLRFFLFWRRSTIRMNQAKELVHFIKLCAIKEDQIKQLRINLITRAFTRFTNIRSQILQRGIRDIADADADIGIDIILRKCVVDFNAVPVTLTIAESLLSKKIHKVAEGIYTSFLSSFEDDSSNDQEDFVPAAMLYGNLLFLCEIIICKIIFRKPIPN